MYRSGSVAVTIGGHVGQRFALTQYVRQGCPLAPYLFLFFAETMSLFLRGHAHQIHGLCMPIEGSEDLLDQEYVDDTLLFCDFAPHALDSLRIGISIFCCASGARINWHKSSGFLVAEGRAALLVGGGLGFHLDTSWTDL